MAPVTAVAKQLRPRVLAADSTPMSTQLLAEALGREAQFEVIESPSDPRALLQVAKKEKPHVAVIPAQMEGSKLERFDLVQELRAESPTTRIVVMLDFSERTAVTEAFRAGAQGVFCRTESFRSLAKCIQCVANGQIWANSAELQYLLDALSQPEFPSLNLDGGLLSARETDVVRCLTEGLTNREIAKRLKLTEHTVKNYLFRIFDKLGVSSRVEVVLYAIRNGKAAHASAAGQAVSQPILIAPRLLSTDARKAGA